MPKKFYAVYRGLSPGVYEDWKNVEALTKGVSGCIYKSFYSLQEAEFFSKHGRTMTPQDKMREAGDATLSSHVEHIVIQADPSKSRVLFWERCPGAPEQVKFIRKLDYSPGECSAPDIELKAVAEQLTRWARGIPKVLPDHTAFLKISVTRVHTLNVLKKYMQGWEAAGWKTSRGVPVTSEKYLRIISEVSRSGHLPCDVDYSFSKAPVESADKV
jgi:hypothetical protein